MINFTAKMILALVILAPSVNASAFGSKFVCCRSENVSCLGGGGATVWHRTLRDRALTQVDAKARCGFHRMFWNTHSCPADTQCPSSSPNTNRPTATVSARICNQMGQTIWLSFAKRTHQDQRATFGWWELKNGQCQTYADHRWQDARLLYVNAVGEDRQYYWPKYPVVSLENTAMFCQNPTKHHAYIIPSSCSINTPGLQFNTYGLVSGLASFTFRR